MTAKEVLIKARKLIDARWSFEAHAKDKDGTPVSPLNKNAAAFSIDGAIIKVTRTTLFPTKEAEIARSVIRNFIDEDEIGPWNDKPGRTKAEVLLVIDQAIAAL